MNLATLKTHLQSAITSGIEDVTLDYLFDYLQRKNKDKVYPIIVVDIGNESSAVGDIRDGSISTLETWIYCIGLATPEADQTPGQLTSWDTLEVELKAYLNNIQALPSLPIETTVKDLPKRYVPSGFLIERETAVAYKITITMHC